MKNRDILQKTIELYAKGNIGGRFAEKDGCLAYLADPPVGGVVCTDDDSMYIITKGSEPFLGESDYRNAKVFAVGKEAMKHLAPNGIIYNLESDNLYRTLAISGMEIKGK